MRIRRGLFPCNAGFVAVVHGSARCEGFLDEGSEIISIHARAYAYAYAYGHAC